MSFRTSQSRSSTINRLVASPRPKCQSCEGDSLSAVAFCLACDCFYCENCWKHHQGISPSRSHPSITLDQALTELEERKAVSEAVSLTPEEAMANSESIAVAYEGFPKGIDKLQQVMTEGKKIKERITHCGRQVDEQVRRAFAKMHEKLSNREKALLIVRSQSAVEKTMRISHQCRKLSELKTAMEDCHKQARAASSSDDWSDVKTEAESLLARLSEISLGPCENATIASEVNTDHLIREIESFGYVAVSASPGHCTVTGLPLELTVGVKMKFNLRTRNVYGKEITHGGEVVQGMLTNKGNRGSQVMATTWDVGDGTYILSVKAREEGEHLLSVTVHGEEIGRSPFVLPCCSPETAWTDDKDFVDPPRLSLKIKKKSCS